MKHIKNLRGLAATAAVLLLFAHNLQAAEPLDTDALRRTLDKLIEGHPTADRTTITLKVVDLQTGEVVYNRGGNKLLVPASNLKIYTAAAALDLLGPDYRWKTEVVSTDGIKRGVCKGDLLIRGDGDPMLNTDGLASLADALVNDHNLRVVRGTVSVQENPRWGGVPIKGPGWMWDDDPDDYNISIRSVMLNFNTLTVVASSGKSAPVVALEPASAWPAVEVVAKARGDRPGLKITREPFHETIRVTGNLPPDAEPVRKTITMHDPSRWIAAVFRQMLSDRGVEFHSQTVATSITRPASAPGKPLASQEGQTLKGAMRHFLKVSKNAVGEMVLLKLAETYAEDDVSWPAGAKVITEWLINTSGLEEGSFRLVDGSGLSRYNLISADSSTKLLTFMKTHEHFGPFFDGLPIYKVALPENDTWDGTPLNTFDPKRVFSKGGGMSSVSTNSGYIQTLDGHWLAFSFLGNGYAGSNKPIKELRNKVWQELIRFRATASTR